MSPQKSTTLSRTIDSGLSQQAGESLQTSTSTSELNANRQQVQPVEAPTSSGTTVEPPDSADTIPAETALNIRGNSRDGYMSNEDLPFTDTDSVPTSPKRRKKSDSKSFKHQSKKNSRHGSSSDGTGDMIKRNQSPSPLNPVASAGSDSTVAIPSSSTTENANNNNSDNEPSRQDKTSLTTNNQTSKITENAVHRQSFSSVRSLSNSQRPQPLSITNIAPEATGPLSSTGTVKTSKDSKASSRIVSPALTPTNAQFAINNASTRSALSSPSIGSSDAILASQVPKKEPKKIAPETPSTNTMTVETETVSAVPALAVAGVPESSIKVKKNAESGHNKNSHRSRKKKASRLGSHVPTKAEVFASKIASAVDEAQSSDSDETFIYESNPADQQPRSVTVTTPIGTIATNATSSSNGNVINNGSNTSSATNVNSSGNSIPSKSNSVAVTPASSVPVSPNIQQLVNPSQSNLGSSVSTVTPGSITNHATSPSVTSISTSDSYQTLTANSRRNISQKSYQQQLYNLQLQQQQPLLTQTNASVTTTPVGQNSHTQQNLALGLQIQSPGSLSQQGNVQLHHQNSSYFNKNNQTATSEDYFPPVKKPSLSSIKDNTVLCDDSNSALTDTSNVNYQQSHNVNINPTPSDGIQNHSNDYPVSSINSQHTTQEPLTFAAGTGNSTNGNNQNNGSLNANNFDSIGSNNTVSSVISSNNNAGTINSTGTVRHYHSQSSIPQLAHIGSTSNNTTVNYQGPAPSNMTQAQQQGLIVNGDPIKDDFKTLKKKPSNLRNISFSSSLARPESSKRRASSKSTAPASANISGPSMNSGSNNVANNLNGGNTSVVSGRGVANTAAVNGNHPYNYNHQNNLRHQQSMGLLANHYKSQYEASIHSTGGVSGTDRGGISSQSTTADRQNNASAATLGALTESVNGNPSSAYSVNNSTTNLNNINNPSIPMGHRSYGPGNYRQNGPRWLYRLDDSEYVDDFYDSCDNNSDNEEEDDERYLEYSETTPLRKGPHGLNSSMYTHLAPGSGFNGNNHGNFISGGIDNTGGGIGSGGSYNSNEGMIGGAGGYNRRIRGSYGANGFRAYSPHNYQRRYRNSSHYEKLRRIVWFCFAIVVILLVGFIMGFVLATTKPLREVNLARVFDILVSDEELVFDVAVEAINPGYLNVEVHSLDLDVFARSPYVKGKDLTIGSKRTYIYDGENSKRHIDRFSQTQVHRLDEPSPPSSHAMLLGNIRHFEVPLVFGGGVFEHHPLRSIGQLKLVNPGLNATLPDDDDGNDGNERDGENGKIPDTGRGDFDGDDDFDNPTTAQWNKENKENIGREILETKTSVKMKHSTQTLPIEIVIPVVSSGSISTLQDSSKKHLDDGQKRWAIVNTHPFELILRGVIKYQLALDSTPRVASITRTTNVDPSQNDGGNHHQDGDNEEDGSSIVH